MADARTCPDCGSELPAHAPEGLCPRCLLGAGLASDVLSVGRGGDVGATMSLGSGGVLETITATLGAVPRVLLRDTDVGLEPPIVRPDREAGHGSTRYRIDGEIARGGMGAVLRGRDPDIGRDVAIKVLREDLLDNPDMVRRFVEEAQIGGQLQHPGIVPIYELGAFADRRPFFSMKLVKGHTLAGLLDGRKDPTSDLARLLDIVESVAQTVAYAHARGVIHRDLKPSNVMVGSFGEVQVMDWGLAKVLPRGGVVDDATAGLHTAAETVISTARSGSGDSDLSQAGSVLGTPSYMAPEQARGEIERVDERADVFALGSILCEVLTGRPAFTGRSPGEIQRTAALGDTADALGRLDACGADPELVDLARDCLAREPEDRPRHGGDVAGRLSAHLAGVQDRLRAAELAEVEARAHAEDERKRRKLTVALAASLIGTAVLVGGGWAWTAEQRAERAAVTGREVNQALAEAAELRGRARATGGGDLALLELSLAEAKRSTSLLARGEGDAELRERARSFLADVTRERDEARARATEAERDRRMTDRLTQIKVEFSGHNDRSKMDADYAAAFREYGLDIDALPAVKAGAGIVARRIADDLVSAIDQWTFCRRAMSPVDPAAVGRLIAVANEADSDTWRKRLRDALGRDDRGALRQLAATADIDHLTPESASRLAYALTAQGDAETSVALMRAVLRHHREDFWLNFDLVEGLLGMNPPRVDEALQYATAEAALRPRSCYSHFHLGLVQGMQGRHDESIAAYREAIRLDPGWIVSRGNLAQALQAQGKRDEAIAEYREAIRLKSAEAVAHYYLGNELKAQGRRDESIAEYREAARLDAERNHAGLAVVALGSSLRELGRPDEAVAIYRQILKKSPRDAAALLGLANELKAQGRPDEAIDVYREASHLNPQDAEARAALGVALFDKGDRDGSIAAFGEATRLRPIFSDRLVWLAMGRPKETIALFHTVPRDVPSNADALAALAHALKLTGQLEEAVAAVRASIRLKPESSRAHQILGWALLAQKDWDGAIPAYREAIRLKPFYVSIEIAARFELAEALRRKGRFEEAIGEYRRAKALGREAAPYDLDRWIADAERASALVARLPAVLRGEDRPKDSIEGMAFGQLCHDRGLHAAAARLWGEGLSGGLDARLRYNAACSAVLAGTGAGKDEPRPDEAEKARLRREALDWLKADLAAWSARLTGDPKAGPKVAAEFRHRKADADLSGVRDAAALAKLPEPERKDWQAVWADVDALLERAQAVPK